MTLKHIWQLMIVDGNMVYVQGRPYMGEVITNSESIQDNVQGEVVFIVKLQDVTAISMDQADKITGHGLIVDLDLPTCPRLQSF